MLPLQVMMMMIITMIASERAYSFTPIATKAVSLTDLESTPSLRRSILFERGAPVMVEGDEVQMSCPSFLSLPYTWRYLNRSSSLVKIIGFTQKLSIKTTMLGHSGQYNCTAGALLFEYSTELTVVERLSHPTVVVSSQSSMVLEGSGLVTMKCVTSSGPSHISWSWNRQGGAGLQEVGTEQELTLGRLGDSGQYLCRAHTSTLGLTQEHSSPPQQVNIIPSPAELPAGTAALVLVLLCLLLLLLVFLWLFVHRETKTAALDKLDKGSPAKGLPGRGIELKEDSKPTEDDVYMNCETSGEGFTDLNRDEMSENTYDCLS